MPSLSNIENSLEIYFYIFKEFSGGTSQNEGSGFEPDGQLESLCVLHSLCLRGFPPGTLASSNSTKTRLFG